MASTWFKDTTCDSALKLLLQRASWLLFTSHPTKVALGHQIAASAKRVPWPHMGSRTMSPSRMSKLRAIAQASTWCMPWKGKDPPSIIWFCCRMGISSRMKLPSTWQWTVRSGDPGSAMSTDKSIDEKKHPKWPKNENRSCIQRYFATVCNLWYCHALSTQSTSGYIKLHRHRPQIDKVGTDGSQRGNQRLPWQGPAGSQTLKLTVPNLGTSGYHCKELPVPRG